LLVDVSRLAAEVRFEQAEAGGQAFPHVHGLVNLDAVFDAAPYRRMFVEATVSAARRDDRPNR